MRRIGDRYEFVGVVYEVIGGPSLLTGDYRYEIVSSPLKEEIGQTIYLTLNESYATYLGNFAKSTNFNSLYEKLVG